MVPPPPPHDLPEENLDTAIHHLERVLRDPLDSVGSLSSKASGALGFTLTPFSALFSLGRSAVGGHLFPALVSAGFFLCAIGTLAWSYQVTEYHNPPGPGGLLLLLDGPLPAVKRQLVANLAGACTLNNDLILRRFGHLNIGIFMFVSGTVVFVLGVMVP